MNLQTGEYCQAECTDLELATVLLGHLKQVVPDIESEARQSHWLGTELVTSGFEPLDNKEDHAIAELAIYLFEVAQGYVPEGYCMGFQGNDWHRPFGVWEEKVNHAA